MSGMEGAPKQKETLDFESGEDGVWKLKQESASKEAEKLIIEEIDDFENLEPVEQVEALKALMTELAIDNDNRFKVEYLAKVARAIEATAEYEKVMAGVGSEAGSLINQRV